MLASPHYADRIDWQKIHVFWGDERAVPFEDNRNNARMAFDTLLHKVEYPPEQIHMMDTGLSPEAAAMEYEEELFEYFGTDVIARHRLLIWFFSVWETMVTPFRFFPGTPMLYEEKLWVISYFLKEQDMYRITSHKKYCQSCRTYCFHDQRKGKSPCAA